MEGTAGHQGEGEAYLEGMRDCIHGDPQERRLGLLYSGNAEPWRREALGCITIAQLLLLLHIHGPLIRLWPGTSSKEYGRSLSPEFPSRKVL